MNRYAVLSYALLTVSIFHQALPSTPRSFTPRIKEEILKQRIRPGKPPRIRWDNAYTYRRPREITRFIPQQFTTSIIIPCYYKHASLLTPLLEQYTHQTVLPDEIVISLSEYQKVADDTLQTLLQSSWPFRVTLVLVPHQQFAGENRNTACDHATGDVFICQDADDIAHVQRVEIIRHFFDLYPVEHLFHEWIDVPEKGFYTFPHYADLTQISFTYHQQFKDLWYDGRFTNGNIAITRHVFDKIRWTSQPRGQDSIFNKEVYQRFKYGIAIKAQLLGYRQFLSSTQKGIDIATAKILSTPTYAHPRIYQTGVIYLPQEDEIVDHLPDTKKGGVTNSASPIKHR